MKADNMYNRSSKAETRGIDEDRDGETRKGVEKDIYQIKVGQKMWKQGSCTIKLQILSKTKPNTNR